MYPTILIAYDATPEAADGLALGRLLANLFGAELHVARVLADTPSTEATDRDMQSMFRATLHETQHHQVWGPAKGATSGQIPIAVREVPQWRRASSVSGRTASQGSLQDLEQGLPERAR